MKSFLENPIFLSAITFFIYFLVQFLQKKYQFILLHPVLICVSVLVGYLLFFNISYQTYAQSTDYISFWLKPSIVALGVPLYLQSAKIKKQLIPLLISQCVGSVVGIVSVCYISKLLGADNQIISSLAPKSVTTPIALEISQNIGGITALTVACVIVTGMFGAIFGFQMLRFFGVKSPMAKGVSLGTASHALGIMAAMNVSEKYAVYASLGMIFNGIFTAILAPILVPLIL